MQVAESRRQPNRFARELFDPLPPRYDRLAAILSLGQNGRWRRAMVGAIVSSMSSMSPLSPLSPLSPRPAGRAKVLDVATGPAGVALQLARRTPAMVTGIDLTEAMVRMAVHNVRQLGQADRIQLLAGRAEQLPFGDATFDAVTFTYLLRYVSDPAATVQELVRVVKPGGILANLEFHVPAGPVWHPLWLAYTRAILPAAGLVTGGRAWWNVGRFLGPSISEHYRRYPLAWQVEAWRQAGVEDVTVRLMSLGGGLVMWGRRAGSHG